MTPKKYRTGSISIFLTCFVDDAHVNSWDVNGMLIGLNQLKSPPLSKVTALGYVHACAK